MIAAATSEFYTALTTHETKAARIVELVSIHMVRYAEAPKKDVLALLKDMAPQHDLTERPRFYERGEEVFEVKRDPKRKVQARKAHAAYASLFYKLSAWEAGRWDKKRDSEDGINLLREGVLVNGTRYFSVVEALRSNPIRSVESAWNAVLRPNIITLNNYTEEQMKKAAKVLTEGDEFSVVVFDPEIKVGTPKRKVLVRHSKHGIIGAVQGLCNVAQTHRLTKAEFASLLSAVNKLDPATAKPADDDDEDTTS